MQLTKISDENLKTQLSAHSIWLNLLLLSVWFIIGIILRLINLDAKPASSIEIATLGFSLGHGFASIPLDRVISVSTLLSPLKFSTTVTAADVVDRLMSESTHPPLYFWLTHWWTKLFLSQGELASLVVGRSLSAIFGSLAIPAIFGLSWVAFRSRLVAHFSGALMAVSPFGIYLAQEARHYTLTILWIIISLTCAIAASQCIEQRTRLPYWLGGIWILVNSLGVATHYFFSLALGAEALVILGLWLWDYRRIEPNNFSFSYWWRIAVVGLGTLAGCLVWLPVATGISSHELTDWIQTNFAFSEIWQPLPRMLAWLITMVMLLPVEGTPTAIIIVSALVILGVLIAVIPALIRSWRLLLTSNLRRPLIIFAGYWLGEMIIYLLVIYGLSKDVSLAARYHFVYFPAVIVLVAVALGFLWQENLTSRFGLKGKQVGTIILLMGFLGSLTVVNNLGFQKSRHADLLAAHIQTKTTAPALIAMTYETHSQLRELIALALSFERLHLLTNSKAPQFLLVQQNPENEDTSFSSLSKILSSQTKPLDLWGINLKINSEQSEQIEQLNCIEDKQSHLSNDGYSDRLYHCR